VNVGVRLGARSNGYLEQVMGPDRTGFTGSFEKKRKRKKSQQKRPAGVGVAKCTV
jgi:hypothetical protein